jgi:hypothetical protein
MLEKNVEALCESKERCYEKSLDCAKKLKDSFAKVGAYSLEQNFIRGDPEGVIEWIGEEGEAFEEIISDRGDFCAVAGARGVVAILEKTPHSWRNVGRSRLLHRQHEGAFDRSYFDRRENLFRCLDEGRPRDC